MHRSGVIHYWICLNRQWAPEHIGYEFIREFITFTLSFGEFSLLRSTKLKYLRFKAANFSLCQLSNNKGDSGAAIRTLSLRNLYCMVLLYKTNQILFVSFILRMNDKGVQITVHENRNPILSEINLQTKLIAEVSCNFTPHFYCSLLYILKDLLHHLTVFNPLETLKTLANLNKIALISLVTSAFSFTFD